MPSEFITRVEHEKEEPYTVIFKTDDADKYKQIEDECRKMIGHAKPTVDAVPWEFLERYADWFCASVSFPEFIREAKAFYRSTAAMD